MCGTKKAMAKMEMKDRQQILFVDRITPAETDERPHNCHVRGYKHINVELVDTALEY